MGIAERKNRQRQALRERILDAARRIVIREGFGALSMRKIAEAIEYSPASLYLHFASRDEIARALCEEGYAQLLDTFVPLARIAEPAARLKAIGRAYVGFGVEHPQTYRLIFMEDPSYTGAALGGTFGASRKGKGSGKREGKAATAAGVGGRDVDDDLSDQAGREAGRKVGHEATGTEVAAADGAMGNAAASAGTGDSRDSSSRAASRVGDNAGSTTLHIIMIDAFDELRTAGRLSAPVASMDPAVWAEALWASLHGIVALNLTYPVFPSAPLDTVVDVTLDVWLGAPPGGRPQRAAAGGAGTASAPATRRKSAAKPKQSVALEDPHAESSRARRKAAGP